MLCWYLCRWYLHYSSGSNCKRSTFSASRWASSLFKTSAKVMLWLNKNKGRWLFPLLFKRKLKTISNLQRYLQDQIIEYSNNAKLLVVFVDNYLKWETLVGKTAKRNELLYLLLRIKHFLDWQSWQPFFNRCNYITSIDYCPGFVYRGYSFWAPTGPVAILNE